MSEMYFLEEGQLIKVSEAETDQSTSVRPDAPSDKPSSFRKNKIGASRNNPSRCRMIQDVGTAICELPVVYGLRQPASVEAVKQSTVLMLQKSDLFAIMQDFPDATDKPAHLQAAARRRCEHQRRGPLGRHASSGRRARGPHRGGDCAAREGR